MEFSVKEAAFDTCSLWQQLLLRISFRRRRSFLESPHMASGFSSHMFFRATSFYSADFREDFFQSTSPTPSPGGFYSSPVHRLPPNKVLARFFALATSRPPLGPMDFPTGHLRLFLPPTRARFSTFTASLRGFRLAALSARYGVAGRSPPLTSPGAVITRFQSHEGG